MPIKKPRFNWLRQRPHKIVAWFQRHEKTASWGTTIFTGLIFLVTTAYATVAYFQWRAMQRTVSQTQELIGQQREALGYASTQASAAKTQADIASAQKQAVMDAAQAAKDSASAAQTVTEQNKDLIKAAQTQANTSQVAARAAESSAKAAEVSTGISEQALRAYLSFESVTLSVFEPDKPIMVVFVWANDGNSPAIIKQGVGLFGVFPSIPRFSSCASKELSSPELKQDLFVAPKSKRTQRALIAQGRFSAAQIQNVKDGKQFFGFCGSVIYTTTGREFSFPVCSYYDRDMKAFFDCPKN